MQQQQGEFALGTAPKQKRKKKKAVAPPVMQGPGLPQGGAQLQQSGYGNGPPLVQGQPPLGQGQPHSFQFASAQLGYAPHGQYHP